jgi:hypothetical protein
MNAVEFAERSKCARHEAVHAAASLFLGITPDEVRILPLADGESGYVQGHCLGRRESGRWLPPPSQPASLMVMVSAMAMGWAICTS